MRFRPCPCGNRNIEIIKDGPAYDSTYVAECPSCGIRCRSCGRSEKEAQENWNEWIRRHFSLEEY